MSRLQFNTTVGGGRRVAVVGYLVLPSVVGVGALLAVFAIWHG